MFDVFWLTSIFSFKNFHHQFIQFHKLNFLLGERGELLDRSLNIHTQSVWEAVYKARQMV